MTTVLGFSIEPWGSPAIGAYLIPGTTVTLTIRKEIAPLLVALARDFNREVEPLRAGWCWGFNPKRIEGATSWSNHAWGGAVDLNAPAHPMGSKNTFSVAKRTAIHQILGRYTYKGARLFRWGGDYLGRHDDMHFEINVPRATALAAVKALQTPTKPSRPTESGHVLGSRLLELTSPVMSGADVAFVQRWTGIPDDGKYGSTTKTAVIKYQKMQGLTADGICGAATWSKMLGRTITQLDVKRAG